MMNMKRNFAKRICRAFFSVCGLAFLSLFFSCYAPSPLYGTWSDNLGNKLTFLADNSYTSVIVFESVYDEDGNFLNNETETYEGSFSVVENVLSLSTEYGLIVTEWDIRGSVLYIDWTMPSEYQDSGEVKHLKLYHN